MANAAPADLASLPAAYRAWRTSDLGRITDRIEEELILTLTAPVAVKKVLDVGRGDGVLSVTLARQGANVTGVDVDRSMLEAARDRARGAHADATYIEGNARSLPFADGTFDVVVAITVLCFVPDAGSAVSEMARVLRPGGRLVIGELGRHSLWTAKRGAIYYPPCNLCARLLGPIDRHLAKVTTTGAAFIALAADKLADHS